MSNGSDPDQDQEALLVLILFQTVCEGYQQMTKGWTLGTGCYLPNIKVLDLEIADNTFFYVSLYKPYTKYDPPLEPSLAVVSKFE